MSIVHRIYLSILTLLILLTIVILVDRGYAYYHLPLDQRFFNPDNPLLNNPDHALLKPGGIWGHGMGIIGTLFIIFGIVIYMARKRIRSMARWGKLNYWLEFHIFLCTLGPILVLFHTAFKFGGLVAVSFWSMVAVFLSGVIGRFIYLQIPRTIEGRELTLSEVKDSKTNVGSLLTESYNLDEESYNVIVDSTKRKVETYEPNFILRYVKRRKDDRAKIKRVRTVIKNKKLNRQESGKIIKLVKHEVSLNHRIDRLLTMQKLFAYWHVAHFPFAIVMLLIMVVHVAVTVVLGYRWIF